MEEGGDAFAKEENTSNTVFYSFAESYDSTTGVVTQRLGNNGVLNISKDDTLTVNVSKSWDADDTDHPDYVMVSLYVKGTKTYEDGTKEEFTEIYGTEQLDDSNNWKHAWEKLPREKVKNGVTYSYDIYYVGETYVEGSYTPVYTDGDGNAISSETIPIEMMVPDFGGTSNTTTTETEATVETTETAETTESAENESLSPMSMQIPYVKVTYNYSVVSAMNGTVNITNHTSYKLPSSGGIGNIWFTLGAITSIFVALIMYILNKRKNMRVL
jgi:LPXTG-motif cell wall-anchored protein